MKRLKVSDQQKIYYKNLNWKKAGVGILISEQTLNQGKLQGTRRALHNHILFNSPRSHKSP